MRGEGRGGKRGGDRRGEERRRGRGGKERGGGEERRGEEEDYWYQILKAIWIVSNKEFCLDREGCQVKTKEV